MINITFPDGSVRSYEAGVTPFQIAESISPRLAADVLVASVDDEVYDLERPIEKDASLKLHKWEDDQAKRTFWHSSSHLMAEALEAIYPGVKFGIGPAIDNGFYYDVDLGETALTEADLKEYDDYKLHYPEIYNLYRSEIEYREHGPVRLDPYRKYRTKQHKYGH